MLLANLATFAHISYLSKSLSASDMGTYFLIMSIAILASTIANFGLPPSIVKLVTQHTRQNKDKIPSILKASKKIAFVTIFTIFVAVVLLGEYIFSHFFDIEWKYQYLFLITCWFVFLTIQAIQSSIFRANHDIKYATFFGSSFRNLLYLLTTIFFVSVSNSFGIVDALYCVVLSVFLNILIAQFLLTRKYRQLHFSTSNPTVLTPSSEVLSLAFPLFLNSLAVIVTERIGLWAVGNNFSKDIVAYYGASAQIATLIVMPILVVNSFTMPLIVDMYYNATDRKKLERILRAITTLISIPISFVYLALLIFGKDILTLIFNEDYQKGYSVLILIATGKLFNLVCGPCGLVLKMTGHHVKLVKINYAFATVTIILVILTAPAFGPEGVALVIMLSICFQNLISLGLAIQRTGINTCIFLSPGDISKLSADIKTALKLRSKSN